MTDPNFNDGTTYLHGATFHPPRRFNWGVLGLIAVAALMAWACWRLL